jgi:glycosyltransferase involved in cell wall biosynthesis
MAGQLVSVVVPVFNGEQFLGEAIDSVLAQTYEPVQLIVVDDGSTDASAEVAEGYEGVAVVRHERNRGPAVARNRGIEKANGALITFLDADDLMKTERIEKQVAAIDGGADCVLALEEHLVEPGIEKPKQFTAKRAPISDREDLWVTGSLLATREAIERIGAYDESMPYSADTDYVLRAMETGLRVEMLDEKLTIRRFHGGNLTYDFAQIRGAMFQVLRRRIVRRRGVAPPPSEAATDARPPTEG